MKQVRIALIAGMAASSLASSSALAQTISWLNPVDGLWSNPANWTPTGVPNASTQNAVLGLTGPYVVTLDISPSIRSLTISNSAAELEMNGGTSLSFTGLSLTNSGRIVVNTGTTSVTTITFPDGSAVTGGGTINLNPSDGYYDRAVLATAHNNTDTARFASGTIINGEGILRGLFTNEGTIAGGPNNGPTLANVLVQQGGGQIQVVGNGKSVSIGNGGYLLGGTMNSLANGIVATVSGQTGTVDSVTNLGTFVARPGSNLVIASGGLTNNGTLQVNTGTTSTTGITLNNGATLGGTGTVFLSPASEYVDRAYITTAVNGTATGNLGAGLSVSGEGSIYGIINSQATIVGGINQGPTVNGLFTQTGQGRFSVSGPGITASIGSGTVTGGLFETSNGGQISSVSGRTGALSGVTNTGHFRVAPGSTIRVLAGGLTNDGSVSINDGSTATTYLELADNAELGGSGVTTFNPASEYLDRAGITTSTNNGTASIGANATVNGEGTIYGVLINKGTIAGGENTGPVVEGRVTQQGNGRVFASGLGQTASIGNGTVINGTFGTGPGGVVATVSGRTGSVSGVTNNGAFRVSPGSSLRVLAGGFNNNGTININSGSTATTVLEIADNATLGGSGTVSLTPASGYIDRASITSATNSGTATFGAGLTINGEGSIYAYAINRGTISGGPGTGPIVEGTITQQGAGKFSVQGVDETASIGSGTVRGGTFETANGGRVATVSGRTASIEGVNNLGTLVVRGGSALQVLPGGTTNSGTLYVNDGGTGGTSLVLLSGSTLSGSGTVTLNPADGYFDRARLQTSTGNVDTATIGAGQTINGNGQILGTIRNGGRIAPGVGIGHIDRPGSITQEATGIIEIEMAGASAAQRDSLTGAGVLRLAGTLRVRFLGGYLPAICSPYAAITGGQISGHFDAIDQPPTGHGTHPISVRYTPTSVTIVYRPQDFNGDDIVDLFDYLDFLNEFSAATDAADYNHDGSVDFFDYLDFVQDFAAGGC